MRPLPILRSTFQSPAKLSRNESLSSGGGCPCAQQTKSKSSQPTHKAKACRASKTEDVDLFTSGNTSFSARIDAARRLIRGEGKYRNARRDASTDVPRDLPLRHCESVRGRQCRRCREQSRCCHRNRAVPKSSRF